MFFFLCLFIYFSSQTILSLAFFESIVGCCWEDFGLNMGARIKRKLAVVKKCSTASRLGHIFRSFLITIFPQENQGNEFIICTVISLQCEEWRSLGHHNEPRFAD